MPSKQIVDLVNRLKKSGINISFTAPRSKILINLQGTEFTDNCVEHGLHQSAKKKRKPTLYFI